MRLVASFTRHFSRVVLLRDDLREVFGPGAVHFVAAYAQKGSIQFWRRDGAGIVGMLRQRAMAGLAVHRYMLAFALHRGDIRVASLASPVSSENNRLRGYFRDGISAIVAIFAETAGY